MKTYITYLYLPLFSLLLLGILTVGQTEVSAYKHRIHKLPYRSIANSPQATRYPLFDDYVYQNHTPIGFRFYFNGKGYDSLIIHENGFVSFGHSNEFNVLSARPLSQLTDTDVEGIISAMGTDLAPHQVKQRSFSQIRSKCLGQPGQRVFVIEWVQTSFKDFFTYQSTADTFSFQIQLFEKNQGIRIHYGKFHIAEQTRRDLEIGIRGQFMLDMHSLYMPDGRQGWLEAAMSLHLPTSIWLSSTSFPQEGLVIEWKPLVIDVSKKTGFVDDSEDFWNKKLETVFQAFASNSYQFILFPG